MIAEISGQSKEKKARHSRASPPLFFPELSSGRQESCHFWLENVT